ncbi:MAG: efflux RND transporter periplasmic adaptor subunit, partial [Desulfobacterales bacterium]
FLIAKDLTRMQVWVAVNEADIGKIHPGQPVRFTVDAFPDETFTGSVGKVRLNASMTQNVVTYTVEIITSNTNGRLLPYLTANVQFELKHLSNVLLVPNLALRWNPKTDQIEPRFRKALEKSDAKTDRAFAGTHRSAVWAVQGQYVKPIPVTAGLSDGTMTEIQGQGLSAGLSVVTGIRDKETASSDTRNPFTPQFLRRSRTQKSQSSPDRNGAK